MLKKTGQFNVNGRNIMQWCNHLSRLPVHHGMIDAGALAAYDGLSGIPSSVLQSTVCTQSKAEAADACRLFAGDVGFANLDQSAAEPDDGRGGFVTAASTQVLLDSDDDEDIGYVQRDMDLVFNPFGTVDNTTLLSVSPDLSMLRVVDSPPLRKYTKSRIVNVCGEIVWRHTNKVPVKYISFTQETDGCMLLFAVGESIYVSVNKTIAC